MKKSDLTKKRNQLVREVIQAQGYLLENWDRFEEWEAEERDLELCAILAGERTNTSHYSDLRKSLWEADALLIRLSNPSTKSE